jgi:flagellar FliL protein
MAEIKKSRPKKMVIIAVLLVVAILGGMASAVFMFTELTMADVRDRFEKHEEYVVTLDSFTVNLSSGTGSYLKTQISLMYTDKEKTAVFAAKTSQIRDIIIRDLMAYTSRELLEAGGLDKVKEKLRTDINTLLGEEAVKGIFFTDFLIQ